MSLRGSGGRSPPALRAPTYASDRFPKVRFAGLHVDLVKTQFQASVFLERCIAKREHCKREGRGRATSQGLEVLHEQPKNVCATTKKTVQPS